MSDGQLLAAVEWKKARRWLEIKLQMFFIWRADEKGGGGGEKPTQMGVGEGEGATKKKQKTEVEVPQVRAGSKAPGACEESAGFCGEGSETQREPRYDDQKLIIMHGT